MSRAMNILLYTQNLSGTGHYVRTSEIASELARRNRVWLVEGGRPVPRCASEAPFEKLVLPPLYRTDGKLVTPNVHDNIDEVMDRRLNLLVSAVKSIRPDILVIEHFPFSKLELQEEILPLADAVRKNKSRSSVICSLRDIVPLASYDPEPEQHRHSVLRLLSMYFDRLLVHSDPALVRLEDYVPWAPDIPVPVIYTGYVSQKLPGNGTNLIKTEAPGGDAGKVVVSAGGAGGSELIQHVIDVWRSPEFSRFSEQHRLVVFQPLYISDMEASLITESSRGHNIEIRPYSSEFINELDAAALSISEAGYNTCINMLETRKRCILIPNVKMSDQYPRAKLLAGWGLATMIHPDEMNRNRLMEAIIHNLKQPPPKHDISLDGARITAKVLEDMGGMGGSNVRVRD